MDRSAMGALAAFCAAVMALGGCFGGSDAGASRLGDLSPDIESPVKDAPYAPFVVWERPVHGEVTLRVTAGRACDYWHMRQLLTLSIYDVNGKISETAYPVEREIETMEVALELTGEPPFLVAGDAWICARFHTSVVIGADAIALEDIDEGTFSQLRWCVREDVSVHVAAGALEAEVTWNPADEVYDIFQVWMESQIDGRPNPEGARYGTILMVGPDGEMLKQDTLRPFGDESLMSTFQKVPGEYRIRVTLDSPWPTPSNWTYSIQTFRFDASICALGFEWEICGRPAPG